MIAKTYHDNGKIAREQGDTWFREYDRDGQLICECGFDYGDDPAEWDNPPPWAEDDEPEWESATPWS